MPNLFEDFLKSPTTPQVHSTTALGNVSSMKDRKQRLFNETMADATLQTQAKSPDVGLEDADDGAPDAVHGDASKKFSFKIAKADPDQKLVFGWAYVSEKDGKEVIDKQGDIIPIDVLEKSAYEYAMYFRNHGDLHQRVGTGQMVESMVFTQEKQKALGIDLKKTGWWVGFKVHDDELWAAHKRGERPEFSIGGEIFLEVEE